MENYVKIMQECSYDSPADFLWFYILKGCGCGSSSEFKEEAWKVFDAFANGSGFSLDMYNNPTIELLAHWIDSKNLVDHGSSIQGSWLNGDGKKIYELLIKNPSK